MNVRLSGRFFNSKRLRFYFILLFACAATFLAVVFFLRQPVPTTRKLADGTVLQLDKAAKGRQGTFVIGTQVQRALWHWFGNSRKLRRSLRWLNVERPITNTIPQKKGNGMLSFWFTIKESKRNGFQLRDYFLSNNMVEIVNRHGGSYTHTYYPGVPPDASLLFLRVPGSPTNEPTAIRFLAKKGTNWITECEVPIEHLYDFSEILKE